jgi:hypothetical protein
MRLPSICGVMLCCARKSASRDPGQPPLLPIERRIPGSELLERLLVVLGESLHAGAEAGDWGGAWKGMTDGSGTEDARGLSTSCNSQQRWGGHCERYVCGGIGDTRYVPEARRRWGFGGFGEGEKRPLEHWPIKAETVIVTDNLRLK